MSTSCDELSAWCREQTEPLLELLEQLVEQNSHSAHPEGGRKVHAMLRRELEAIDGVHCETVESERFAPHLVATTTAAQASADGAVLLVGHHDTVFPPGTFEGFTRDGDLARGPGVLDMKSGLCLMIFALRGLAQIGLLDKLPVRMISVGDEEVGSPESFALLQDRARGASCALVFEAGRAGDAIITARKGTGGVKAIAHGIAAHSGNHHADGANAIWALARMVDRVQALTDYDAGVTVNVGTIGGGQSRNTVPEHAEILIDLRYIRTEDGEALLEKVRNAAAEAASEIDGTRIALEGGLARPPLERSAANVAVFEEYAACAVAAGLDGPEASLIGGGSDASTTAAAGVPSIDGLGPRGSGFHTKDEQIQIPSLPMKLEALARFLHGRTQ